jgi:hypothetical protein
MEHPFLSSTTLNEHSLEDLQKTITDLNSKLNFAYRTNNMALANQLLMVIDSYNTAYRKKVDQAMTSKKINDTIKIEKK